jgi:hypothetical protein
MNDKMQFSDVLWGALFSLIVGAIVIYFTS